MGYLNFDKDKLVNLSYSLERETLRTIGSAYSSTTLAGCNTRKYHGLLVVRLDELDGGKHVLLSTLDETVIQHEAQFNLGIHKFPGDFYEPKGHKYIRNFEFDTIQSIHTGRRVILTRTRLLVEHENTLLVKYTLEEANSRQNFGSNHSWPSGMSILSQSESLCQFKVHTGSQWDQNEPLRRLSRLLHATFERVRFCFCSRLVQKY